MIILFCRQNSSNEIQVALMLKKKKVKQLNLIFSLKSHDVLTNLWVGLTCGRFCQVAGHVSKDPCSWNNLGHR